MGLERRDGGGKRGGGWSWDATQPLRRMKKRKNGETLSFRALNYPLGFADSGWMVSGVGNEGWGERGSSLQAEGVELGRPDLSCK